MASFRDILGEMDNGMVAQYNQSEQRFWTYFKARNLARYLDDASVWWIEAIS